MHGGGDKHRCGFCDYDYFGPAVSWLQLQKSRLRQSPESSANKTLAYHNKQTLWTPTLACTLQLIGVFVLLLFSQTSNSASSDETHTEKKETWTFSF